MEQGDTSWQKEFLAAETWRNLRMTCRGFFGYCRCVLAYAEKNPDTIKTKSISPSHSNSSVLEAYFSLVRMYHQDDAPSYLAFSKSRQMISAHNALRSNPMYSEHDVGDISTGKDVGIPELTKCRREREGRKNALIMNYEKNRHEESTAETKKFSLTAEEASAEHASLRYSSDKEKQKEKEVEVLRILTSTDLLHGYMSRLTELDTFHKWVRLCLDNDDIGEWFDELFRITQTKEGSIMFNDGCRAIQDKLLSLSVRCMRKRSDKHTSFEKDTHNFFKSDEFDQLCSNQLPGNLGKSHVGCVLLGLMLAELFVKWLTLALRMYRKDKNPELFRKKQNADLKPCEENNEVNSFVGWAISSAKKKFATDDEEDELEIEFKELLKSMSLLEEDADEEYLTDFYDTNMSMLNHGGLTLVSREFFEWGKITMKIIRSKFTVEVIQQDPRNCFKNAKDSVLKNASIRTLFVSSCNKLNQLSFSTKAIDKVYKIIVPKVIHARFAVEFRQWKELYCKKHESVAFRTQLKATVKDDNGNKKRAAENQAAADESVVNKIAKIN
jgi:hypothetical protein